MYLYSVAIITLDSDRPLGTVEEYFSTYATIEEPTIYPTAEQALVCLRVCQMLSNTYSDIHLFRFNEQRGYVFILAGNDLQILVFRDGSWRFINAT